MWWTVGKFFVAALLAFKCSNLAIWLGMPSLKVTGYGFDLAKLAVFLVVFNLVMYLMNLANEDAKESK